MRGIQLVLLMAHSPRDYQMASRYLRSGHVDGAVLVSMHGKGPLDLHSLGVPVVLAGRPFGNDEDLSHMDADNVGGARMAVQCLLSHGRGTVGGPPDTSPGVDRMRGYWLTMADAWAERFGADRVRRLRPRLRRARRYRLLDRRPGLDAVFVASDLMAAGALRALRRSGRRVPDDAAVIGFEDSPLARHTDPKLTTVRQPVEAMGERPAGELLALIGRAGKDPVRVVLDTELVIRESA